MWVKHRDSIYEIFTIYDLYSALLSSLYMDPLKLARDFDNFFIT